MNILLVLHCVTGYGGGGGRRAAAGLRIGSHCYSTAPITKSTKSTRTAHALVSEPDPSTIVQVLELLSGPPKYICSIHCTPIHQILFLNMSLDMLPITKMQKNCLFKSRVSRYNGKLGTHKRSRKLGVRFKFNPPPSLHSLCYYTLSKLTSYPGR